MPKQGSGRTYVNQGVSFPPLLLAAAKQRSKSLGLTLSRYMQICVETDLARRGPVVLEERDENRPPVP